MLSKEAARSAPEVDSCGKAKKIGVFGGTFDPVHNGHIALARAARMQFGLDKVFLIPTRIPPHKTDRLDLTSDSHRVQMLELAVAGEPDLEISRLELERPGISYTVDTLRSLIKQYPKDEFFLILGADAYDGLKNWNESSVIRSLAKLLVAQRPGASISGAERESVGWVRIPPMEISSSQIRNLLSHGKRPEPGLLPDLVFQYIAAHKLYGTP